MEGLSINDAFDFYQQFWLGGLATLVAAAIAYLLLRVYNKRDTSKYPPVAPSGMWETVAALSGDDFPWFLLETAEKLDTRNFRLPLPLLGPPMGPPMVVVVGDPALAREILDSKDSTKPASMYKSFDGITMGIASVFTTNGPFWHSRRKGIAPAFAKNQVDRMNKVALETADQWIEEKLKHNPEGCFTFDIGDEMINVLLISISKTAFEFEISQSEIDMFKFELELMLKEFLYKSSINPLRGIFEFFLKDRRRAHVASKRTHEFCLRIMQSYRTLQNPTKGTIIDLIMTNPCYKDDDERAADIMVLFVGGHDTTAYSIAWALKELALNPNLQSQLRRELAQEQATNVQNNATLKRCIREAIRLHPVSAGGSIRLAGRDFQTKDGKVVPKGSYVFFPFILHLRDPAAFGKDTANEYCPDRWRDPTPEMGQAFLPFSSGIQNCVGQSLANAEMQSIIPRIISQFELTVEQPGTAAYFLTLKPVNTILKATLLPPQSND